jgi:glycosyltransferase involved in cell wall biosynthesis
MPDPCPALSIVVPVCNEEGNLELLMEKVKPVLESTGRTWEMLFVNDASTDKSLEVLKTLHGREPRVRVLAFKQNCGETAAGEAGMREAHGEIIITMDADLQNDPDDIPMFLAEMEGWDMVTGRRATREDSWSKRIGSRIANRIRDRLIGDGIQDSGCTYRAFRRACLERIKLFRGMHRFLPALFMMEGFRVKEVPVRHHPRHWGTSKYTNWGRMWKALVDCLAVRWMKKRRLGYEIAQRFE